MMKKILTIGFLAACAGLFAQTARSAVLTNDNFSYTGALTANGWFNYSGTGASISSDGSVALIGTGAEDVRLPFADRLATPVFATFKLNVSAVSASGHAYTFGFIDATSMDSRWGFTNAGTSFSLAAYGAGSAVLTNSALLSTNTDYLITIYFDGVNNHRLWIDSDGTDFATPDLQVTVANSGIDGFFIRQASPYDGSTAGKWSADDLVIGTAFEDVVASATPPTNVSFAVSSATVGEAAGTYDVTIVKSLAEGEVTGELVLGGTATLTDDFTISATNITLSGATTSTTVTITIDDDAIAEITETVSLTLTNVAGGNITPPSTFTLEITDNDVPPSSLIISEVADPVDIPNTQFVELYNAGAEAIDLGAGSYYLSIQVNGGTNWGDIALTGTVAAGETYVIARSNEAYAAAYPYAPAPDFASVSISGNGDDGYFLFQNGDHTAGFLIDAYGVLDQDGTGQTWEYTDGHAYRNDGVTNGSAAWISTDWTFEAGGIVDVTPGIHPESLAVAYTNVRFSGFATSVVESVGTYTVIVYKTVAEGTVSGEIALSGTATEGADYTVSPTNFVLDGVTTSATITVTVIDDPMDEPGETVVLTIANVTGGAIIPDSVFTLTINDNDLPPPPENAIAYYTFTGNSNTAEIVALNATATPITISSGSFDFQTANSDTWTGSGVPYIRGSTGWTSSTQEGAKQFSLTVSAVSGFNLTITNVSFRYRATAAGPSAVGFTLDGASIFAQNATQNVTTLISQPISGFEDVSSATLGIQGWTNGTRSTTGGGEFHLDDIVVQGFVEAAPVTPTVQFALESASVSETGVTYDVTITKSAASGEVSGEITVGGTAPGADYSLGTTNISLIGEVTSQVVSITIVDNAADDGNRTVILGLANLVNADPGAITNFTLTIQDDDEAVVPELPVDLPIGSVTMVGGNVQVSVNAVTGLYYYLVYPNVALSAISVDPIDVNQWGVASSDGPNASGVITLEDSGASVPERNYGVLIRTEDLFPEP